MALSVITPQRPGATLRPGGGRAQRRLARTAARAGKTEDLDRTNSLRTLMAKPGILLVGFGGSAACGDTQAGRVGSDAQRTTAARR